MGTPLADALETEHRAIDEGIERFLGSTGDEVERGHALDAAFSALRRHIYLEETFLFPDLRASGLAMPVFVMVREHAEMWRLLDAVDEAAKGGDGAPGVPDLLADLTALLAAHNPKEEQVLYSQIDLVLAAPATDELRTFLASGRLPEGWVCEGL